MKPRGLWRSQKWTNSLNSCLSICCLSILQHQLLAKAFDQALTKLTKDLQRIVALYPFFKQIKIARVVRSLLSRQIGAHMHCLRVRDCLAEGCPRGCGKDENVRDYHWGCINQ